MERKYLHESKKIVSLVIAALLIVMSVFTVTAAELTEDEPGGQTEVKAHIDGNPIPGEVSYIITIPDVVDFGLPTRPANDEDSYKDVDYTVEATVIEGLDTATEQGQQVNGKLRLNQRQLYGYDITDIIGNYSGYMVFYSIVEDQ